MLNLAKHCVLAGYDPKALGLKCGTAQEPLSGALRFATAFTRHVVIVAAQLFQFSAPN